MFSASHSIAEVTAFLEMRFEAVSAVAPFGSGEWSQAFSFRAGDEAFVARFGSHREDYEKDRYAARFAEPNLPIPEVVDIGVAFDGVYAVSRRLHGEPLDELDAGQLARTLPSVLKFLDALRLADVSGTRGYGGWTAAGDAPFGSWREYLLAVNDDSIFPRIAGWRGALESRSNELAVFEAGYRLLEGLAASLPEERYLVHTDIVGDNVRVFDAEISAVVDWGNAIYGDFLYDLARLTFWVPWYPKWAGVDFAGAARAHYASIDLEVPAFEERLRACQVHIGLDAQVYNVFTARWDELVRSGQRTLELARP